MLDKKKLEELIKKSRYTVKEIACELDVDVSTLYRKINGTSDFYREEIAILCDILKIDDPKPVFFGN